MDRPEIHGNWTDRGRKTLEEIFVYVEHIASEPTKETKKEIRSLRLQNLQLATKLAGAVKKIEELTEKFDAVAEACLANDASLKALEDTVKLVIGSVPIQAPNQKEFEPRWTVKELQAQVEAAIFAEEARTKALIDKPTRRVTKRKIKPDPQDMYEMPF